MSAAEGRIDYATIKLWVLGAYYDFCRDRGHGKGFSHDGVLGAVEYEYETAFSLPIENLMLKVVELVLSGGWHREVENKIRDRIKGDLREYGVDHIRASIPSAEAEEFLYDLKFLKLIDE